MFPEIGDEGGGEGVGIRVGIGIDARRATFRHVRREWRRDARARRGVRGGSRVRLRVGVRRRVPRGNRPSGVRRRRPTRHRPNRHRSTRHRSTRHPTGIATWDDLVNHAERVKTRRRSRRAACRAFFKMEEAAARGGIVVGAGWRCVDVGASPGGWTQWLTRRLAEAEAALHDRDGDSVETAARSGRGHVWSVDPAR